MITPLPSTKHECSQRERKNALEAESHYQFLRPDAPSNAKEKGKKEKKKTP